MIKNRVNPLFFVFIRGVNVVKTIQKVSTLMSTLVTHFVLSCPPNRPPKCPPKPIFYPKNTPLQPHKTKKTAFNRSKTY